MNPLLILGTVLALLILNWKQSSFLGYFIMPMALLGIGYYILLILGETVL